MELSRLETHIHNVNRRVNLGWNNYLIQYLSIFSYLSVTLVLIANFFPGELVNSTLFGILVFGAFVYASYRSGKTHEIQTARQGPQHLNT